MPLPKYLDPKSVLINRPHPVYANSTTRRCPKEIIKNFLIEDFFHLLPVSLKPVANLELRIFPRIFEKIETALMV
jgi:hypothetical protein